MAHVLSLLAGSLLVIGTLIIVSLWRSKRNRKWFYLFLAFYEILWALDSEWLFPLLGIPRAWQDGAFDVLVALFVPTLVLLYRHRRDPDPPDLDAL